MEEIKQIPEVKNEIVKPEVIQEQTPKPNSFIITLLSSLLLFSVLIAGFFAYQTQRLVKEMSKYQTIETPFPTSSSDPTTEWNIYNNSKFLIKLPRSWTEDKTFTKSVGTLDAVRFTTSRKTNKVGGGDFTPGWADIVIEILQNPVEQVDQSNTSSVQVSVSETTGKQFSGYTGVAGSVFYIQTIAKNTEGLNFSISMSTQDEDLKNTFVEEYNQILSTFKFVSIDPMTDWKNFTMIGCSTRHPEISSSIKIPGNAIAKKLQEDQNRTKYQILGRNLEITIDCDTAGIGDVICTDGGKIDLPFTLKGYNTQGCYWDETKSGQYTVSKIYGDGKTDTGSLVFYVKSGEKVTIDQILSSLKILPTTPTPQP